MNISISQIDEAVVVPVNKFDCPNCGKEVNANDPKSQLPKKICYQCLACGEMIRKCDALILMEKKDGIRRWSLVNCLRK